MHSGRRELRRIGVGLLFASPWLVGFLAFTVYPFIQMIWVSLTNWTLIEPPRFVGLDNFSRAFADRQFWISLSYTLKYTLIITPILMIGGYAIALLTSTNTPLRRLTRAIIFVPVVIGLGSSSLLWYWLFSPRYGLRADHFRQRRIRLHGFHERGIRFSSGLLLCLFRHIPVT